MDARCRDCGMYGTSKEEKDAALKEIEEIMVQQEAKVVSLEMQGMYKTFVYIACMFVLYW